MRRTASGRWRAVNMISNAPTNGDHVISESTGTPRVMDVIASSPPELSPDEEEEHAEGDTVDVVLGLAALDPAEHVATSQRPRAQHIQNAVDEVAVDPTDQAREAQDKATVEPGVERVEAVPTARQEVDRAEQRGQRGRAHDPALIGRPRQHEAGRSQTERQRRQPVRAMLSLDGMNGEAQPDPERESGQDPQRYRHQRRRVVRMSMGVVRPAEEREEDHPE